MKVDIHVHFELLEDIEEKIERCKKDNFHALIANGINLEANKLALNLSKKYPLIKASFGLYPDELENLNESQINETFSFIEKNIKNIVALGEIGLDFSNPSWNKEKQIKVFERFISLGKKHNLALIIHSRKAEKEVIDILEKNKASKVVLHCFSGNFKLIEKAYSLNYNFSIPCTIVKSEHFQKLVKEIKIANLLTETDSTFLSPFKDKKNEPFFINETLKKISEIKQISLKEAENKLFENYKRLFEN